MEIGVGLLMAALVAQLYWQYDTAARPNGNILLGVTLPAAAWEAAEVKRILKSYRMQIGLVFVPMIPVMFLLGFHESLFWLAFGAFLAFFIGAGLVMWIHSRSVQRMYRYKCDNGLLCAAPLRLTVDTMAGVMKNKKAFALLWQLVPAAVYLVGMVWSVLWHLLPISYLGMGAVLMAGFTLMQLGFAGSRTRVICESSELNVLANQFQVRMLTGYCLFANLLCALCFLGYVGLTAFGLSVYASAAVVVLLLAMTLLGCYAALRVRTFQNELTLLADRAVYQADEDLFWQRGYYSNPHDSRVFVQRRFGMGFTTNMGNWKGKAVCLCGAIFFLVFAASSLAPRIQQELEKPQGIVMQRTGEEHAGNH